MKHYLLAAALICSSSFVPVHSAENLPHLVKIQYDILKDGKTQETGEVLVESGEQSSIGSFTETHYLQSLTRTGGTTTAHQSSFKEGMAAFHLAPRIIGSLVALRVDLKHIELVRLDQKSDRDGLTIESPVLDQASVNQSFAFLNGETRSFTLHSLPGGGTTTMSMTATY